MKVTIRLSLMIKNEDVEPRYYSLRTESNCLVLTLEDKIKKKFSHFHGLSLNRNSTFISNKRYRLEKLPCDLLSLLKYLKPTSHLKKNLIGTSFMLFSAIILPLKIKTLLQNFPLP